MIICTFNYIFWAVISILSSIIAIKIFISAILFFISRGTFKNSVFFVLSFKDTVSQFWDIHSLPYLEGAGLQSLCIVSGSKLLFSVCTGETFKLQTSVVRQSWAVCSYVDWDTQYKVFGNTVYMGRIGQLWLQYIERCDWTDPFKSYSLGLVRLPRDDSSKLLPGGKGQLPFWEKLKNLRV